MTLASRWPAVLQAVMQGQPRALADSHYPQWHPAPVTGLMNDPNGFIWFAGRYHLFYQWNPLGCDHRYKCWGHWSSVDLVHWQHESIALMPDEEYDRNGCYSGSAVDNNGVLTLCYTGNVKFDDGGRIAWQCLAVQNDDGSFTKQGPVLPLPEGYTGHVRDPKVWCHDGQWYMVLGAQDLQKQGKVLLFTSDDLHHWQPCGEIAGQGVNGLTDSGYMWECPDLFALDETHVLICCPQGLAREPHRYLNTYPSVWMSGAFDYETASFAHGELHELDAGFEFYAPQTTVAEDGRRILIGWMGVPDGEEMLQPTCAYGWIHQMTCPRELKYRDGRLWQTPARELEQLREAEHQWQGRASDAPELEATRLEFELSTSYVNADFAGALRLTVDDHGVRLERASLKTGEMLTRYWQGDVSHLRVLCDSSSIEIFINHGEGVMSSRYFPDHPGRVRFEGASDITLRYWSLRRCMIE
ncbi:TPA: sucrose-6-phosphate hydrolase [Citrobacter koseri]|uniref:Sucrose-6-phosphate hydrolase n=1 Tax=Citrobacter koseri TaxID=545 RepID=A0A2X2V9Y6_CITKO|nr:MULTISPECIES: sucrose-6-phosphate hydrolase [Citrobacter]EKX8766549.1 sucrose-6-phosphate hydrolase [Citrobacter koseri]ELJ2666288.1 sucrose-6-phosphate hydrolase [Citrobacter koseri]MBJ8934101.1 sucrose-6-phosphate hydrolase [Citrobacter koseri]MBJ9105493.1 sucrose-6-phosphate hydrolase [Citrobacter koseri]MBJ9140135.1 sucrose-6-phosphate hydrolase [Citrobacter koseri]